ncbi:Spy/CpxP family protein refolding chaperone [Paraburkholderia adhaesiva]|uniref:Spy/CpxP family protein refolding chaperone n=1 Tax=Paraburkholderia adhaesiva TaxID=2883244 RepID=UPI001F26485E|nr:Spy/CpxP family protein refolding chaperone [Paraburkholderia adhaesiva]
MKKAIVVLATALSMSGAFAQNAATPAAPSSAAIEAGVAEHQQRVEERIAFLHSTLKITPEQEALWKPFADQMRTNGRTMGEMFKQRAEGLGTRNALDDMKEYAQITQAHADEMQKLVTAFEPLYNSFSADQKAIADKTFRHGAPERGGKGGKGGNRQRNRSGSQSKPAGAAPAASDPAAQ